MEKFCSFGLVAGQETKDPSQDKTLKKSSASAELNKGEMPKQENILRVGTDLYDRCGLRIAAKSGSLKNSNRC
jgi:hypothetical protein